MRPLPWGFDLTRAEPRQSRDPGPGRLCRAMLLAALMVPVHLSRASAVVCHTDAVPAATLLLPYFEVNLDDPNGLTTLFSVNNAATAAVLAHVAIWSDLGVPLLNFNVYLTGYDVQTINLRDVVLYGQLPQTASVGQDPFDTISPKGQYSQDIDFPSCQGQLPPAPLSAAYRSHLQNALTGKPSPVLGNLCAGQNYGDKVARGYITVDTVNDCTVRFPGDPGYFAPAGGDVTDQNVLWGGWYIVNAAQGYAEGSDMVAIEADGADPATSSPGRYTFYGRYDGWSAVDHREPLATTFAAQFAVGGGFSGGTDFLVWRDSRVAQAAVACPVMAGRPGWYPLPQEGYVIFDEQEHPVTTSVTCVGCPPSVGFPPFPAATQRIRVGGPPLPVPFDFGWLYLDLNASNGSAGTSPPADPRAQQSWVVVTQSSHAHFAVALDAYRLDSACSASHVVPHQ